MSYNSTLPEDITESRGDIRENLRALKEDKIVDAATAVVADSADKLTTARKISLKGDATGNTSFDGSADVAIQVNVLNADNADTIEGKTVNDIIYISSPAGAVQHFAMANAPTGWLKADGSAVSRKDYANLFSAIGTTFGIGDGNTTFNLPDLRGEFVRGLDAGRELDSGRVLGSTQQNAIKKHGHAVISYPFRSNTSKYTLPTELDGTTVYSGKMSGISVSAGANCTGEVATSLDGGSETRPRNIALLACIKY